MTMLPPKVVTSPLTCPRMRTLQPKQVTSETCSPGPTLVSCPNWVRSPEAFAKAAVEAQAPKSRHRDSKRKRRIRLVTEHSSPGILKTAPRQDYYTRIKRCGARRTASFGITLYQEKGCLTRATKGIANNPAVLSADSL